MKNIGYDAIPHQCRPGGSCPECNGFYDEDEEDDVSVLYYKVGGYLRDHMLGIPSKDIDFAVVAPSFDAMLESVEERGCQVFQSRPESHTLRALHPNLGAVDFVWARREGPYTDGRHPDFVLPGSIEDDLARHDFTMNAMAVPEDGGSIIDPHDGLKDIKDMVIRCVGDPIDRFREDGLRVFRALRFSVTKNMVLHESVVNAILSSAGLVAASKQEVNRVREELVLMMKADWWGTFSMLGAHGPFGSLGAMVEDVYPELWFKPTVEKR